MRRFFPPTNPDLLGRLIAATRVYGGAGAPERDGANNRAVVKGREL
jgi:hypothetical protein